MFTFSLSFLFDQQRIGYLAASQCFHESTDVIMLTTNQIRKVPQYSPPPVSSIKVVHHLGNLFSPLRTVFFPPSLRISAVPTSMTLVSPSPASLVLWPLIWLETWPTISWHWWAVVNLVQGFKVVALYPLFNVTIDSQSTHSTLIIRSFDDQCLYAFVSLHCRCPTQNRTSGRKRCWSCTRCF